ncbi:hypothetical protein D3C72_2426810 [compost metagenome]
MSVTASVLRLWSMTWETLSPSRAWMSRIVVSQMNSILGWLRARSCMIFEARNESRRCTT